MFHSAAFSSSTFLFSMANIMGMGFLDNERKPGDSSIHLPPLLAFSTPVVTLAAKDSRSFYKLNTRTRGLGVRGVNALCEKDGESRERRGARRIKERRGNRFLFRWLHCYSGHLDARERCLMANGSSRSFTIAAREPSPNLPGRAGANLASPQHQLTRPIRLSRFISPIDPSSRQRGPRSRAARLTKVRRTHNDALARPMDVTNHDRQGPRSSAEDRCDVSNRSSRQGQQRPSPRGSVMKRNGLGTAKVRGHECSHVRACARSRRVYEFDKPW